MRWAPPESRSRHAIRDHIEANLDPVEDHQEITFLSTCYDFPWDTQRALELALIRVFGIAKSSPLLARTGEFLERTRSVTTTRGSSSPRCWRTDTTASAAGRRCGA